MKLNPKNWNSVITTNVLQFIFIFSSVYFAFWLTKQGEEAKIKKVKIKKVNIYDLEPFFLPIRDNGKETDKFISISANLLLSNRVLHLEIGRVLPLVRKNIYNILRRKRPSDFTLKSFHTEERIKQEIRTACNALLSGGTGTIKDVFFTRFVVK